ncbi:plasmid recombination protein [Agrobacterium leguminum]|uniref:plasmid recombination protein n=1 Tax=Agrobacterium leguminum TaxID=2792015 RepID=UPI00272C9298|nr:plasmid recombination protein [Agrobacterium leguminum]WLD95798.1 plasmid recombination protein [Agrobacterium leguminum]
MGYQFVHLEGYARKPDAAGRGTDFIFSEASRKPEASIHVEHPLPPVVVYGVGVQAVQEMHDAAVASATVAVKGGKTRKLRSDQKTLHTVVASHPFTMDEIRADPDKRREAEAWEKRTVKWLQRQYGDDLKSVIRHEDESYFHIHAYVVPTSDPELKAQRHHPGATAKRSVMDAGPAEGEDQKAVMKRANAAYKATMRAWQDSYHEAVAVPSGLTRLGPQRRRLSRDEWQREQVQARSLQKVVQQARKIKTNGEAYIDRTKTDAAKIAADAAREQEAARKATAAALTAQDRARRDQEEAKAAMADAARYGGWAGRLRAVWDNLRRSKLAERIRSELSGEIDRWRDKAKDAERKQLEAERQRYEAEQKARAAQDAAFKAGIERDRLRSMLSPAVDHSALELSPAPKLVLKPNFQKREERNA